MDPEKSLELLAGDVEETNSKAVKLRAGRGDNLGVDNENAPGRSEKLVRMAREKFGDDMVLMIDGNGTYSVEGAVRFGKLLQEHNFYFYEEPVPWDWYQEQKQVADVLDIPMAGGEEEFGMHAFRWLIANNAFEILQPDTFYFGGMIRSMKVARMAQAAGKQIVPTCQAADWVTCICCTLFPPVPMPGNTTNSKCLKPMMQTVRSSRWKVPANLFRAGRAGSKCLTDPDWA